MLTVRHTIAVARFNDAIGYVNPGFHFDHLHRHRIRPVEASHKRSKKTKPTKK